ncbi:hypothetical protein L484_019029 [Morus notabilis]|uniref:DOG1 domain-containing protein n=1 Tax=Morus notabilis TaxID=981085 RepID=W9R4P9_9ROSA|nr:protein INAPERTURATE POLLEN1 [Morus notabilis]EXB54470.1 hypothetical protein L484_019029 [Morus notabilis]
MMKSLIPCWKKAGSNNHRRRPFKEYHEEWFDLLKNRLLPSLRRAMHESSVAQLSTHVDILRHHLTSYYDALDLSAASDDVAHLLHPSAWRTPFETPFLWLSDLHPYLFTNLLRSFLSDDDENDENNDVFQSANLRNRFLLNNNNNNDVNELFNRPWHIVMAWRNPPASLMARIDQIECGVRLMVPALAERARKAQERFVQTVAGDYWGGRRRRDKEEEAGKAVVGKAVMAEMDEMVGVLVDANRLRRSVLAEIIGATSVYQAAMFLEGLAQFLVGFRDPDLVAEFQACKTPLN